MRQPSKGPLAAPARRRMLKQTTALGAVAIAAPYVLRSAHAQANADIAPYQQAKINWRQAEGEEITIAFIPASYFDNLIALQPTFEALSGVKVRFEKVPPGQIRQKAMLDLSSKTATYATSATDPMYYPLYVSNKWVEPLDKYLGDHLVPGARVIFVGHSMGGLIARQCGPWLPSCRRRGSRRGPSFQRSPHLNWSPVGVNVSPCQELLVTLRAPDHGGVIACPS